jgi:hypothetical protein
MQINFIFHISYDLLAGILSLVLQIYFFAKILCTNFICKHLFQSAQHLYEKKGRIRIREAQKHVDHSQHCLNPQFCGEKHLHAIVGQGSARCDVCARDGEAAGERSDQRARAQDPRDHSRPPRQDRATSRQCR